MIDLKKTESGRVNQVAFVSLALNLAGVKELKALIEQSESGLLLSGLPYADETITKLDHNLVMLEVLKRLHFEVAEGNCGDMTFKSEMYPGVITTVRYNNYDIQWIADAFYHKAEKITPVVTPRILSDEFDLEGYAREVGKAYQKIQEADPKLALAPNTLGVFDFPCPLCEFVHEHNPVVFSQCNKIFSIKHLRNNHGLSLGLKECKDLADWIYLADQGQTGPLSVLNPTTPLAMYLQEWAAKRKYFSCPVCTFLGKEPAKLDPRNKIMVIKHIREDLNVGLREAKELADWLLSPDSYGGPPCMVQIDRPFSLQDHLRDWARYQAEQAYAEQKA
jgi:hypothetical protein